MLFVRLFLLVFYIGNTRLHKHGKQNGNIQIVTSSPMRYFWPKYNDGKDVRIAYNSRNLQRTLTLDDLENNSGEVFSSEVDFSREGFGYRRTGTRIEQKRMFHSSTGSTSTSFDTHEFKEEWAKRWNELKEDALHPKNALLRPGRNIANMVAARPWYKPCGDPTLHDVPWGTCTLNYECDGEYRIYRGDVTCGRTQLVCCAVEGNRHDMNQAFDVSFADTSIFSTSSEEEIKKKRGSKENRRRKRVRKRKVLEGVRYRRKRSIKKMIRKVVRQIRKELNRAFRNNTHKRRLAIINLKILINAMKKKFIGSRQTAVKIHAGDWMRITTELENKLNKIRMVNQHFLTNDTFREVIVNGTIKKTLARQLVAEYPELLEFPEMKALQDAPDAELNGTRRSARGRKILRKPKVFLHYYI